MGLAGTLSSCGRGAERVVLDDGVALAGRVTTAEAVGARAASDVVKPETKNDAAGDTDGDGLNPCPATNGATDRSRATASAQAKDGPSKMATKTARKTVLGVRNVTGSFPKPPPTGVAQ